jgi:hypothetical protein
MATPKLSKNLFELPVSAFGSTSKTGLVALPIQSLTLESLNIHDEEEQHLANQSVTTPTPGGLTCNACNIKTFTSQQEQRAHFKTDYHRYNVKRRVSGLNPVDEAAFESLLTSNQVGSISGSETSSLSDLEEEDEEEDGQVTTTTAPTIDTIKIKASTAPHFLFKSNTDNAAIIYYGVWRCLVAPDKVSLKKQDLGDKPAAAADLEKLNNLKHLRTEGGKWAVLLLSGGHFAGGIYDIIPARVSNPKDTEKFPLIASKSFHRYVVRAKAGGKQSSKDATGKFAKSAGSQIRRHNEALLIKEVEMTLKSWKDMLGECSLIMTAAPSLNSQILFSSNNTSVLSRGDSRVRQIPFVTRRPTISETKRVVWNLCALHHHEEGEGERQQRQLLSSDGWKSGTEVDAEAEKMKKEEILARKKIEDEIKKEARRVAEEEVRRKKVEKKARQKAKQKEQNVAEAGQSSQQQADEEGEDGGGGKEEEEEDEIAAAAAKAAALKGRLKPVSTAGTDSKKASAPILMDSKSQKKPQNAAKQRELRAAAAERRVKALEQASQQQKLW